MTNFDTARHNMVENQVRTNKVTDTRLIGALANLPREKFVPKSVESVAYMDEGLPLGNGRYLMEPMVLARLLQIAEVGPDDAALDVGCATGYSTAVLGHLCNVVVGLELDANLATEASRCLADLGVDNAAVIEGPFELGYDKQAPYDVILLSGAVGSLPTTLCEQLAEGGRLVGVVAGEGGMGQAHLWLKRGGVVSGRPVFDAGTPVLPGFERKPSFVF